MKNLFNSKVPMKRLVNIVALATILAIHLTWITPSTPVKAIASPDTFTINSIQAFQSVINTNDQLHIVTFTLDYTSIPTTPANEAWLFRLTDDGNEIAVVAPNAFFNSGYSEGVVSFYFTNTDANLPVWATANLSIEMVGNPSLSWNAGNPPSTSSNVWQSFNVGNSLIPARIRILAANLENVYSLDMIETIQGVLKLTSIGESYFEAVITNLRLIAPDVFSTLVLSPEYSSVNHTLTYAEASEDRWLTSGNGTYDMTEVAGILGISRNWTSSLFYVIFCVGILFTVAFKIGEIKGGGITDGSRPATFIFGCLMVFGSFAGFMVFEAAIFVGVVGILAIVYALFWRGSI